MPKWKSPLFSDIRNAIGDNVVFSNWKGRPFFRSYVVPANPQTDAQMAHRATMAELVSRYQSLMADPLVKAEWNVEGLPYLLPGFNIFCGWGRKSTIYADKASGSAPLNVLLTYTCGIPLEKAKLYQLKDSTWSDITPAEGLQASGTKQLTALGAGTYYWFIADKDVLKEGESSPKAYQAITKWFPDEDNGVAKECKCVVS